MIEYEYTCPYCSEEILTLLDPSITHQSYIEDCQVCCNPISLDFVVSSGEIIEFSAIDIEQ